MGTCSVPIHPDRRVATTSSISPSPISGLPKIRYSLRTGSPPLIANRVMRGATATGFDVDPRRTRTAELGFPHGT